ncbi:nucleoside-diphosphate-sugar epimerase [Terriglobus roseus DSM 18391]|uniref:Nucleoside-diphosphate-sugar epimerase n=1 Tax=Terriglobus roseus (strain DSM 18391 / NRRL B-41598 / KBS 63) TaxID=926566 RepID=I3ZFB8_TERRK|nr:NAD(P)-dependent oxidoreductase [Terriglobus roseus]AFL87936.1 nucleoside-diphosphate-sugar epimerase [Terriglobus roseus DSM 18391]
MMAAKPIPESDLAAILAATSELWETLRGRSIFMTGCTGTFGAWLLESLSYINRALDLRASAVVLSRRPEAFRAKMPHLFADDLITMHAGDARDFSFPAGEFPFIICGATEASAKQQAEQPVEMLSTILRGTERTLQFAAQSGCKRLLLTSSGAVYGRQPSDLVHLPESYTGAPDSTDFNSVYAEGKRASELMCAVYGRQYGFTTVFSRAYAIGGPHLPLDMHFALGNFIRDALAGGPIRIGGDGTPTRSYQYGGDLAAWLWTMLFRAPDRAAYNTGSGESLSILQLAQAVRDALDPSIAIDVAKEPVAGAPVSRYVPSVEKAERELGLRNIVPLDEIIRRTARWYGWQG